MNGANHRLNGGEKVTLKREDLPLKDDTVTLRHRDTMEQKRVKVSELQGIIEDRVSITSLLKKLV